MLPGVRDGRHARGAMFDAFAAVMPPKERQRDGMAVELQFLLKLGLGPGCLCAVQGGPENAGDFGPRDKLAHFPAFAGVVAARLDGLAFRDDGGPVSRLQVAVFLRQFLRLGADFVREGVAFEARNLVKARPHFGESKCYLLRVRQFILLAPSGASSPMMTTSFEPLRRI